MEDQIKYERYLFCWNGLEIEECVLETNEIKYVVADCNGELIVSPFFDSIYEAKEFAENY